MNTRKTLTILVLLVLGAFGGLASGSTWLTCPGGGKGHWVGSSVTMRASAVGFPTGSSWATALQEVANAWNATCSNMSYSISWNEPGVAEGNGQNEVWWSSTLSPPAVCYYWYYESSCEIVEADVVFKNTVSYTTSTQKSDLTPYGGGYRPFRTTAIHEFGHVQGLGHTSDTYSVMGQDWDHIHANGSSAYAYAGEDATAGSVGVYGKVAGAYEDVSVAHWRHTGASGEYSTHDRTRIFNSSGGLLPNVGSDEPEYLVAKGQQVKLEMSYENLGKSVYDVKVGFYLSTNDYISTLDTFLGWMQVNNLGLNTVYTVNSQNLTIPASVTGGATYWLGAIIDYNGAVAEFNEGNNATYTAIRIEEDPPDLSAVSIAASGSPTSVVPGQSVLMSRNIQSVGGPFAGSFTYEVRLSTNTTISTSDHLVDTFTSSTFGSQQVWASLPSTLPEGTYYWGLIVKAVSGEVTTSNNTAVGGTVTVDPKPDMEAMWIKGPAKVKQGKKVTVKFKAKAHDYAGLYTYQIRVSPDTTLSGADPLVASGTASGTGKVTVKFTMPPVGKGKYYWGVIIQPVAYETATGNNSVIGGKVKVK